MGIDLKLHLCRHIHDAISMSAISMTPYPRIWQAFMDNAISINACHSFQFNCTDLTKKTIAPASGTKGLRQRV